MGGGWFSPPSLDRAGKYTLEAQQNYMDFLELPQRQFFRLYGKLVLCFVFLSVPAIIGLVEEGYRLIFYLGLFLSFGLQTSILKLRFLPQKIPALATSGFPMFTVLFSFFANLSVLVLLVTLSYPFEATCGFLIAYFLHLLFLVFASYFSGKQV